MNKKQAKIIVNKSLAALGIDENMKTDPETVAGILEEMRIDDFKPSFTPMKQFFESVRSKPQAFKPMIKNIKWGIVTKHPAIVEFAEVALAHGWLKKSKYITKAVHVTYILEAMTAAMCNSHKFFIEVQEYYRQKEAECGINLSHTLRTFVHVFGISRSFFETFKTISIDPVMIYFRIQRGMGKSKLTQHEAIKLMKAKKINYIEYKLLSPLHERGLNHFMELIRINIYEAGTKEYRNGFEANAISAHELSEDVKNNPPRIEFRKTAVIPNNNKDAFYNAITEKENIFPVALFSKNGVSLYITWNMAFLVGDFNDLDIVLPKLFIPSVISAKPDNFAGVRVIALWLTINHLIFRKSAGKKVLGPRNKTQMAQAWGEINKKYALALAKKETHEDPATLFAGYRKFYSHPLYNILKIVRTFF